MEISQDHKKIAKFISGVMGISPKVQAHWDEDEDNRIDIITVDDSSDDRIKFYSTIGVSDTPLFINNSEQAFRLELIMSAYNSFQFVSNILSTCGFYITKNKRECKPGAVYEKIIEMYYPNLEMKHIFFVEPFLWENKIKTLNLETKDVTWLLCIPISDAELNYKIENGSDFLEELFEEHQINIFDLNRKSLR